MTPSPCQTLSSFVSTPISLMSPHQNKPWGQYEIEIGVNITFCINENECKHFPNFKIYLNHSLKLSCNIANMSLKSKWVGNLITYKVFERYHILPRLPRKVTYFLNDPNIRSFKIKHGPSQNGLCFRIRDCLETRTIFFSYY